MRRNVGGTIYISISSGNISDRILRAENRLLKTPHSVFSRIRTNASPKDEGGGEERRLQQPGLGMM